MPNIEVNQELIHVVVAVIVKDGQVLISKRAQNVHQGGLWEFPGGKIEKDETVSEALFREIKEELGINIISSRPMLKIVHDYPDKSVVLETRMVTAFDGNEYSFGTGIHKPKQYGMEGQQVKWLSLEQLGDVQFPEANKAIINALRLPETYLITPDCIPKSDQINQFVTEFSNSIQYHKLVQLRLKSKGYDNKQLYRLVKQLCHIADEQQSQLILNSSLCTDEELSSCLGSQSGFLVLTAGVHLTSVHLHELSEKDFIEAYRMQFPDKIIAASCHCQHDIERANQLGLDFIVISAVKYTESHPEQEPLGWKQFKALSDIAEMPAYALGGMMPTMTLEAQSNGAQGISAIRNLWNKVN
ncbi:MAG: Nudix family hydrolase [Gammaproteobacteria bacterium]|nr:Nudix family hydrolase [Gammaproteobacteria bacterium]